MLVIVDTNEKVNKEVFASMKKYFPALIVADLPHREHGGTSVTAGDVNIPLDDGSILAIERKTPEDFLGSLASRHLFDQIEVMAQHSKYCAIIVTGYFTYGNKSDKVMIEGRETGWDGVSVRSAMTVIQYSSCALIFCPPSEYCNQIVELYKTVNKPEERLGVKRRRIITFPPVDERIEFLCGMPGIGIKLADNLLKFAGYVENNADEKGYGTLASALHWATIMAGISKEERPAGWGAAKILTVRKYLGLSSVQYLGINTEENEFTSNEDQ